MEDDGKEADAGSTNDDENQEQDETSGVSNEDEELSVGQTISVKVICLADNTSRGL